MTAENGSEKATGTTVAARRKPPVTYDEAGEVVEAPVARIVRRAAYGDPTDRGFNVYRFEANKWVKKDV